MDDLDRASEHEQQERDRALAKVSARSRDHLPSLTHCLDCGYEIEKKRQALGGKERCLECQQFIEMKERVM
ncbi:TraR/DksA family transcriptional regulator [Gammaproteobacteria bacterium]|nr:TraR/DksA family transcriptional regulator [Gammaproteobacteria bacterium]